MKREDRMRGGLKAPDSLCSSGHGGRRLSRARRGSGAGNACLRCSVYDLVRVFKVEDLLNEDYYRDR